MSEVVSQQTDFRVGQIVRWDDAGGTHHGRVSAVTPNGATVFIDDLRSRRFHQVRADRLALVQDAATVEVAPALVELPMQAEISLAEIRPSRWQPRAAQFDEIALLDLANSIQEMGLITPVTVFDLRNVGAPLGDPDPPYELVAGERRTRACIALALERAYPKGLEAWCARLANVGLQGLGGEERKALASMVGATIRATVELPDLPRLHKIAVMENIERQALSPIEEARAFGELMADYGWSQRRLAKEVGKSQGYIAQRMALVDLPELARQAVDAGAITPTHARAIAAVPVTLQGAVAEHVVDAVADDATPATTRQVEQLTRALTQFIKPENWAIPDDVVFPSDSRNRVALIRWLLEHVDLAERGPALIALGTGLLQQNYRICVKTFTADRIVRALAGQDLEAAWPQFAAATDRRCETCQFYDHTIDLEGVYLEPVCQRWKDPEATVCPNWIGADDPAVVRAYWVVADWMEAHNMGAQLLEIDDDWCKATDLTSYLTAVRGKVAGHRERHPDAPREPSQVANIRTYWEWQQGLPAVDLAHVQAHACSKCRHYQPLQLEEGLPPCWFATQRLSLSFGALADQSGRLLPRCDRFQYLTLPALAIDRYPEDSKLPAGALRTWLEAVGSHGYSSLGAVWSALAWLPYDRKTDAADWGKLRKWIRQNWEAIGGDRGLALLLDVAASEAAWRGNSYGGAHKLLNPETGETETWLGISAQEIAKGRVRTLPNGWPDPLRATTDAGESEHAS